MSKRIFKTKKRTLMVFLILSGFFFIAAIALVAPGRKVIHKEYVELDYDSGTTSWYYVVPYPKFSSYLIKIRNFGAFIEVSIVESGRISYYSRFEPFSDSLTYDGEMDSIELSASQVSFQIRIIGIRYKTSPILLAFGSFYGVALIITVIILRLPVPEENQSNLK